MFKGFSIEKLEEFHSKANLGLPIEQFKALYQDATRDQYSFLYIDMDHGIFRKKFDQQYEITPDD
jgi:hypothetical protein